LKIDSCHIDERAINLFPLYFSLIHNCQFVGGHPSPATSNQQPRTPDTGHRCRKQSPLICKRHHHHQTTNVGTNAVSDNNGVKMCCTAEIVPSDHSSMSPCHISHVIEPPSPRVNIKKRSGFLFCCSKRAARRRAYEARSKLLKHEQELNMIQVRLNKF
jgi:hypothetical protein